MTNLSQLKKNGRVYRSLQKRNATKKEANNMPANVLLFLPLRNIDHQFLQCSSRF
jgi:hypothetical protein